MSGLSAGLGRASAIRTEPQTAGIANTVHCSRPSIRALSASARAQRAARRFAGPALQGLALFLGSFLALTVVATVRRPAADLIVWLLDARWLPFPVGMAVLGAGAAALLAVGLRPQMHGVPRIAVLMAVGGLVVIAGANVVRFYAALLSDELRAAVPMPLSLPTLLALISIGLVCARAGCYPWNHRSSAPALPAPQRRVDSPTRWVSAAVVIGSFALCVLAFPLAQIVWFGTSDYARPADVVVVPGAQVDPSGLPSISLRERLATAVDLYRRGLASSLVLSGGRGSGGVHEVDAMRRYVRAAGIPASAIIEDRSGVDSAATVAHTSRLLPATARILVVSHYYHLPRLKLAFLGQGRDVFTVPTQNTQVFAQTPRMILREIPAYWLYFLRAL